MNIIIAKGCTGVSGCTRQAKWCAPTLKGLARTLSLAEVAEGLWGELEEPVKQPFIRMRHALMLWQISKSTLIPGLLSHAVQWSKRVLRLSDKTGYHIVSMHGIS